MKRSKKNAEAREENTKSVHDIVQKAMAEYKPTRKLRICQNKDRKSGSKSAKIE
jgi:hypothetical protein